MWFRTTLYAIEGQWGEGTVADLVITAYHQDQEDPGSHQSCHQHLAAQSGCVPSGARQSRCQLSGCALGTHRRSTTRMPGCGLAERFRSCSGSNWVVHSHGQRRTIYTPPATEGALESITLDIVETLAHSIEMPFIRRPIDRTELLIADELAICGTLAELVTVKSIEGSPLKPKASMLPRLQKRFFQAVRGIAPHPFIELTPCPVIKRAAEGNAGQKVSTLRPAAV